MHVKRLLTIVGARPQFIKAAAISRALTSGYGRRVEEKLLHTGQHHDAMLSSVFFDELEMRQPDYRLTPSTDRPIQRLGEMMCGIERVLREEPFDAVLVYGDTDSTLAGVLAASKTGVPIIHVEAGLRSFDATQPEEQNRIIADRLSQVLVCPTDDAVRNLQREHVSGRIVRTGDIMYDNSLYYLPVAERRKGEWWQGLQLRQNGYILATVHRACNVDTPCHLQAILTALLRLAERMPVVVPLHPRTRKAMDGLSDSALVQKIIASPNIRLLPPASYLEMLLLIRRSSVVLTDSGGVQKEAFSLHSPSVVLRDATEWVDNVRCGVSKLAGAEPDRIVDCTMQFLANKPNDETYPPIYGDGHAAEELLRALWERTS